MVGPASKVTDEELDHFVKSFELLQKVPASRARAPVSADARDSGPAPTVTAQRPSTPAPAAEPNADARDSGPAPTDVAQAVPPPARAATAPRVPRCSSPAAGEECAAGPESRPGPGR